MRPVAAALAARLRGGASPPEHPLRTYNLVVLGLLMMGIAQHNHGHLAPSTMAIKVA